MAQDSERLAPILDKITQDYLRASCALDAADAASQSVSRERLPAVMRESGISSETPLFDPHAFGALRTERRGVSHSALVHAKFVRYPRGKAAPQARCPPATHAFPQGHWTVLGRLSRFSHTWPKSVFVLVVSVCVSVCMCVVCVSVCGGISQLHVQVYFHEFPAFRGAGHSCGHIVLHPSPIFPPRDLHPQVPRVAESCLCAPVRRGVATVLRFCDTTFVRQTGV